MKPVKWIVWITLLAGRTLLVQAGVDQLNADIIVSPDSSGDYTNIQDAVNAVPNYSSEPTLIFVENGIYDGPVNIPVTKTNVVLIGEDPVRTVLTYATEETLDLATLEVYASGFIACNLTIENTAGPGYGPAQAVRQEGDKAIYVNCLLKGNQDTYRTGKVRAYHRNCYFEGTVDFIFGDGTNVFEYCDIYSKGGTAITAASTRDYAEFGYIFRDCRVVCRKGTSTHLGRPWKDYAAVAFLNCELPDEIIDAGWHNWDQPERESTARFAEYRNYGPGAVPEERVTWARMLTDEESEAYNTLNALKATYSDPPSVDNWNPYVALKESAIPGALSEGDGYGMNVGGNRGPVVTVDNESDLRAYATSNNEYVIQIEGEIELTERLDIGSNTTITGLDEASRIFGNILNITGGNRNVIIKNLNISNPEGDGISVWDGHQVLITHVNFTDCGDGSCDINRGSDSVTVSWCRFSYPTQSEHRFTMIADGTINWDQDGNVVGYGPTLHVTLHHNWWYERSDQRMPASTNTTAHIYNNYWNCMGNYYCSNAREESLFYSENNYYDHVSNPSYSESGGRIFTSGNIYNYCTGKIDEGTDSLEAPAYAYLLTSTGSVPEVVTSRAGNIWKDPERYILDLSADGNGRVSPSGELRYNAGQLITVLAEPYVDFRFSQWSGDKEGSSNPLVFFADTSYTIMAVFESTLSNRAPVSGEQMVTIYPNPTSNGSFNIQLHTGFRDRAWLQLYDMTGRLVLSKEFEWFPGAIRFAPGLEGGMYMMRIESGAQSFFGMLCVIGQDR